VSPWGKYEAILDSFKAGDYLEPFVWIEDEIVVIEDQIRGTLDVLGMPYLLVSPEPTVGVTRQQLQEVRTFVSEIS
jgi:hypothetical protein